MQASEILYYMVEKQTEAVRKYDIQNYLRERRADLYPASKLGRTTREAWIYDLTEALFDHDIKNKPQIDSIADAIILSPKKQRELISKAADINQVILIEYFLVKAIPKLAKRAEDIDDLRRLIADSLKIIGAPTKDHNPIAEAAWEVLQPNDEGLYTEEAIQNFTTALFEGESETRHINPISTWYDDSHHATFQHEQQTFRKRVFDFQSRITAIRSGEEKLGEEPLTTEERRALELFDEQFRYFRKSGGKVPHISADYPRLHDTLIFSSADEDISHPKTAYQDALEHLQSNIRRTLRAMGVERVPNNIASIEEKGPKGPFSIVQKIARKSSELGRTVLAKEINDIARLTFISDSPYVFRRLGNMFEAASVGGEAIERTPPSMNSRGRFSGQTIIELEDGWKADIQIMPKALRKVDNELTHTLYEVIRIGKDLFGDNETVPTSARVDEYLAKAESSVDSLLSLLENDAVTPGLLGRAENVKIAIRMAEVISLQIHDSRDKDPDTKYMAADTIQLELEELQMMMLFMSTSVLSDVMQNYILETMVRSTYSASGSERLNYIWEMIVERNPEHLEELYRNLNSLEVKPTRTFNELGQVIEGQLAVVGKT
jgi:hypothetical protein